MAYPFKAILSPIEFDENSLAALSAAKQLGLTYNATVYVLHVVPIILVPGEGYIVYSLEEQEQKARKAVTDITDEHLGGVKHEIITKIGDIALSVLQVAEEIHADLIVMATHGRTGLGHFLLGSVAEKVVREAPCPVLTVRPTGKEKTSSATPVAP